jgi:hypothetical protein
MKISHEASGWKTLLVSVISILLLLNTGLLFAEDASIVQVLKTSGESPTIALSVPDLYISKNAVVVWLNSVQGEEIQVSFKDGKEAMDVSFSPAFKSFCLDSSSCFVTSFIPYAATSSLQFTKTGTFGYNVTSRTGKHSVKGKIVVRDM